MKETTNPFSLAVFNDMLYWSDAKKRVVLAAYKFSGKNHQILLKRPRQPFGVKVHKMLSAVGVFCTGADEDGIVGLFLESDKFMCVKCSQQLATLPTHSYAIVCLKLSTYEILTYFGTVWEMIKMFRLLMGKLQD